MVTRGIDKQNVGPYGKNKKILMTVLHCIKSTKERDQSKSKRSNNEEERPKNEGKIAKCEKIGLSENSGENEAKVCNH